MATEKRLIDANAVLKHFDGYGWGQECDAEIILDYIAEDAPTVDAVEVVRCKDCGMDDREYWQPKPKTNADRIRAMSDEELAKFLYECKFCDICEEGCENCHYNGDCERRLAEWLQQPAEGE